MGPRIITYIRIAGAIAIVALALLFLRERKVRIRAEESRDREQENVAVLMGREKQYQNIILTREEALQIQYLKIDSLAKEIKIKPKQIDRIQIETQTIHDTTRIPVPVYITAPGEWKIADQGECWSWKATATLAGDSLRIQRDEFKYDNETTRVYFQKRTKKFLGIPVGKKKAFMRATNKCNAEETVTEITFIKG